MKFREYRRAKVVEIDGFDGLLAHIRTLAEPWPTFPPITSDTVHIRPYLDEPEYIVTLDGYGVLGFTDSTGEQHGEI